ncbi:MAG: hypothetical protein KF754_06075 [Planctomycetes bacterium]|nr:hypothetical protein [Planctomycetota bacterium]
MASFAVYQHGLSGQFTNWDDNWLISENRHIRGLSWQNIQMFFNPMAPREELGNEYLPVRDLSYAVNYALDGLNPRGYHATNLLLHVFNSLLVMLLAMRLTGRRLVGGLAGLVFAVHPVHVEAVSWLSSRKDLLAAFFLLLSTHLYLAARRPRFGLMPSQSFVQRVRHNTRLSYGLALLSFVLALLSKMPAVVLPALLVLIELFFIGVRRGAPGVSPGPVHETPHAADQPRADVRGSLRLLVPTLPFWGVALLFTALAMKIGTGLMREPYGTGRLQSTLTAISAITRDFQAMFLGWPMQAAVDMPVQTGLSLPVVIGLLLLVGVLALGFLGWRASRAGRESRGALLLGVCGLGALWFLVSLAPVSNFAVQIGTVFAERYLYIPSIGVAVALGACAGLLAEKLKGPVRFVPLAALLIACALWGWATIQAVKPWRDSSSLWARTLELDPENHTAWFNAGREKQELALNESDDARRKALFDGALRDYEQALAFPARTYRYDQARVLIAMASVWLQRDNPGDATKCLVMARDAIEQPWRSRVIPAHADRVADIEAILANYFGLAYSAQGQHDKAVAAFEEAVSKSSRYVSARINLAAELGRAALAQSPVNNDMLNRAWRELAEYERARGRDEASIEQRARLRYAEFSRRLELSGKGGDKTVPADLAPLLDESRALYAELVSLRRKGAMSRRAKARLLVEAAEVSARGRAGDEAAERLFREALTLDPDYVGLRTLLAYLLFERGGKASLEATELLGEELKRTPQHKPALQLKAAGLRQAAVDGAAKLRAKWLPAYREVRSDPDPTWEGLITAFFMGKPTARGGDAFATDLLTIVALMREAVDLDPANEEGQGIVEGTGLRIAIGMWTTRIPNLRGNAESLLRTAFNAKPEDGPVAAVLTEFYLRLAEEVINPPKPPETEEQHKELREGLNELLQNMLTLSEKARRMLSGKLHKVGLDIETGKMAVRNADGEITRLSEMTRRMIAAEFMRASVLLQPDKIEALDWLKHFHQDEGNLIEAVRVFEQLVDALKDRPQLLHGVNLSLAQLQADLGQQMLRAFNAKLKLGQDTEAATMRDKAVRAYLDCLKTTGALLDSAQDPDKVAFPVRLRGLAAQRLAYLVTREAEKYYTIALDAYARLPLDFQLEIAEVRRKRTWFIRDPYRKLAELRETLRQAPSDSDTSGLQDDIRDLERRIARDEANNLRLQGKLADAMARLEEPMKSPTPILYGTRGDIHADMARAAAGDTRDALMRKAAEDYARATLEPEALLKAARLYWEDEALMFVENRIAKARMALVRAQTMLEDSLETQEPGDPSRERLQAQAAQAASLLAEMDKLGAGNLAAARRLHADGKNEAALGHAEDAVQMLGDHASAYHLLGLIQRDIGRARRAAAQGDATAWLETGRDSLTTALKMEVPLASRRVEMMLDLAEIQGVDLANRDSARSWIARAREVLRMSPDEIRAELQKAWQPRIESLERQLGLR